MASGRRPPTDLDRELAQLEREIAAATGERPNTPARRPIASPPARTGDRRLDAARASGRSLLKKLAAVLVLIVAGAVLLKIAFGFLVTLLWLVGAILAVVAILWALGQLRSGR